MKVHKKAIVGIAAFALCVGTANAAGATPVLAPTPFATGLNGPGGIDYQYGKVYVAEGDAGRIISVNPDTKEQTVELTGLTNPSSVARVDRKLVFTTAGSEVPDATSTGDSSVYQAEPGQTPVLLANLKQYELANNPDGQLQFDPTTHEPLDSLSNPFSIIRDRRPGGYVLVADAGANAVLAINPEGKVSNFFLPPLVTTGACAGAPNNDPQHVGCDPVPTGLTYGSDGYLYVSTLSSLTPGEGRVYVLDAWSGEVKRIIDGLDGPTGVTVDYQGNVYVSEVTYGAPEGEGPPPEGFDPSAVGRIVKIAPNDTRTYAPVTMPIGLAVNLYNSYIYATSWSIAGQLGIPDAGQLVTVTPDAFT